MYLEYCIIFISKTLLMLCIDKGTPFYIIQNVLHSAQLQCCINLGTLCYEGQLI